MVNNYCNIQKSCLEQQRIGLPSCKTRTIHFILLFGTATLEIIASDMQLQIKPASSSSIFCQQVVHTTLWYKHVSNVKQNYELYGQKLVSFADLALCFCQCWLNMLKNIRKRYLNNSGFYTSPSDKIKTLCFNLRLSRHWMDNHVPAQKSVQAG